MSEAFATRARALGAALAALFVAVPAAARSVNDFPVLTAQSGPARITAGPDGSLWFTQPDANRVGRITTAGVVTEFVVSSADSYPWGIAAGPDGNVWFTEEWTNVVGRITPEGVITEFRLPNPDSYPGGIALGSDGNLWLTEEVGNRIARITPNGDVTEYEIPTARSLPWEIVAGPDGNLWFTESNAENVGRITTSGVITEFPMGLRPEGIVVAPDGSVWVTSVDESKLARLAPDGSVAEFALAPALKPQGLVVGPDGNVWFTRFWGAHGLGRITPAGDITDVAVPTADAGLWDIVLGSDGNLWFTEYLADRIGRLTMAPAKGDFDGDGQSDLIFLNLADGIRNRVWTMNGVTRIAQAPIVPDAPSTEWVIRGSDDFDNAAAPGAGRDLLTDLVFWNRVTGEVEFWLMDGTTRVGAAVPLTGAAALSPSWELVATAELNHDGWPDLVWRDFTTQALVIWTMKGTAKTGEIVPSPSQAPAYNWTVVAAADYNNDGHTDFLWYNTTSGKVATWYMDKDVVRTSGQFTTPASAGGANWKVVASADFSGGSGVGTPPLGAPDIVWRNATSGNQTVWHMDFASTRVAGERTSPVANTNALSWTIVGPR